MADGYSVRLVKAIESASVELLGVRLGQLCVKHDIPVTDIAKAIGTSRMTVYKWFLGKADPAKGPFAERVAKYVAKLDSL